MKGYLLKKIMKEADNLSSCLSLDEISLPVVGDEEILIKVEACGLCHTDLDEIEGRLMPPRLPIVLGHQIVGIVEEKGKCVKSFEIGDRIGIGWINKACGICVFCKTGYENLCYNFVATKL